MLWQRGAGPADRRRRARERERRLFTHLRGHAERRHVLLGRQLHRRTGDAIWLERARAFAMTAIAQCRATRDAYGRGRYTLWTGDVGLALYLWSCLNEDADFPSIDRL